MISAVCVNHKSFEFLPPLIDSLKREGVGEIIVVDNSLDLEEKNKLIGLEGISLFFLEKNRGLGQALNFGAEKARGDYILFCNPDLLFKEGSLQNLKEEIKDCEATGPLIFWDREEEILLPYPFPYNFFSQFLRISFPAVYKKRYLSFQFKIWEGKNPMNFPLLSGSCFLVKKDCFEKTGGFDESFFLYFE
ncbi:MAG: glycosyltransferase, partial [Thermoanaerobaculia bacterium]